MVMEIKTFRITSPKIILFIDFTLNVLPNMSDIEGYVDGGMYAIVQGLVEEKPKDVKESVLLTTCTLSTKFYLVPTSSFVRPAFVVDNVGCPNKSLFVVPPMSSWADEFLG
jgi:hypothetical protein